MKNRLFSARTALVVLSISLAGCTDGSTASRDSDTTISDLPPADVEAVHHHPNEGPHHGVLIELGAEEYHAELVHDEDSGMVTVYILNSAATDSEAIEAKEVTVNVKHRGSREQFRLAASPDADDPDGRCSRFVSDDPRRGEDFHGEDAQTTLVVSIDGRSYRGDIHHDHDHAGHGHEHD